jgi:segregation and condensation protein B
MSLKAKIEAVIYASEEPVTLAQLIGLLGQEAQRELDRIAARQHLLHLAGPDDVPASHEDAATERLMAVVDQLLPEPIQPEPEDAAQSDSSQLITDSSQIEPLPASAEPQAPDKRHSRDRDRKLREFFRETVRQLIQDYAVHDRGIEVREVAGGYRMATKPEYHDAVRGFVKSLKPPLKLSLQALETLAVVAYKQPVTAPEISEIRGVDSGGVLGSLMARKLISTAGRKQVIGRPILYKTTKDFLLRFGLKDVSELPSIEEFEKMAGELADQEEIHMSPDLSHVEEPVVVDAPEVDALDSASIAEAELAEETAAAEPPSEEELPTIDGRLSGLPPADLEPSEDPSADEAAIQSGE